MMPINGNGNGEVTIICLTDLVNLPDLGIRLTRGAKIEVSLSAAMRSRDLSAAKINGMVSTQTLRASAIRAQEMVSSDTVTSRSPRYVPPVLVDLSPLMDAIQTLTEEVRAMRVELAERPAPMAPTLDMDLLVSQLRGMLSETSFPVLKQQVVEVQQATPQEEPMFIPSHITGEGLESTLEVAAHTTEAPGLVDAAKALKSVRRRR